MTRSTPLLLPILALAAGCQHDEAPAPSAERPTPSASAERPTAFKLRPKGVHVLSPGAARLAHRPHEELDGGVPEGGAPDAAAPAATRTWSFDADKPGEPPAGFDFATSAGKPGKWLIKAEPAAPSGANVLAQLDGDKADARFVTAVVGEPLHDARISVRCKPISGKVEQACGLLARFKDPKSYYVARASAPEKDVGLYVVKDGKITRLGGGKVPFGEGWHELRVEARGDHLQVFWDGTRAYEADDKTYPEAGRVGVWTKADAVTYFDDLSVTPL